MMASEIMIYGTIILFDILHRIGRNINSLKKQLCLLLFFAFDSAQYSLSAWAARFSYLTSSQKTAVKKRKEKTA